MDEMREMLIKMCDRAEKALGVIDSVHGLLVSDLIDHGDYAYLEKWDPDGDEELPFGIIFRKSRADLVAGIYDSPEMDLLMHTITEARKLLDSCEEGTEDGD